MKDSLKDATYIEIGLRTPQWRGVTSDQFAQFLAKNVDNEKLSDAAFREVVRNTLPIVAGADPDEVVEVWGPHSKTRVRRKAIVYLLQNCYVHPTQRTDVFRVTDPYTISNIESVALQLGAWVE